jgi:ABC-type Mn2+/Zn2+ transport system ATPase subunit
MVISGNAFEQDQESLISSRNLDIGFGRRVIASNINLDIHTGERWGIIGPNGAGKTTLIRTLMGVLPPVQGMVERKKTIRFGYVKQRQSLHDLYPFTVFEVVLTGRYGRIGALRGHGRQDTEAVQSALARTGIADLHDRPVRDLSGGQKQRVLIARALCSEPDVIILDEPTNDMDIAGEESVLALIRDVHEQTGAAVMIISHLLHAVLRVAEHIMFINESDIGIFTKEEFIKDNHLERFYDMPIRISEHPDGTYSVTASEHLKSPTHEN